MLRYTCFKQLFSELFSDKNDKSFSFVINVLQLIKIHKLFIFYSNGFFMNKICYIIVYYVMERDVSPKVTMIVLRIITIKKTIYE